MINPATRARNELNDFTNTVRSLGHPRFGGWEKSGYWVCLRNGTLIRPVFEKTEDETCEDAFFAENYKYCWNLLKKINKTLP